LVVVFDGAFSGMNSYLASRQKYQLAPKLAIHQREIFSSMGDTLHYIVILGGLVAHLHCMLAAIPSSRMLSHS